MTRWALPLLVLAVALGLAMYYQQTRPATKFGYTAPDFRLSDLSGQEYQLTELRGKVVFLNVWATWCPPCREEMPSMEQLYQRLAGEDFVMLAVSEDAGSRQAVEPFVRQLDLSFPILLDPKGVIPKRYGVTGYPETFIIDRAGRVIQHLKGPENWASEPVQNYLVRVLAEGGDAAG